MADPGSLRVLLSHIYAWPEHHRGAERYLIELARHLQEAGHTVHVLTTAPTASEYEVEGVPVLALKRKERRKRRYGAQAVDAGFARASLRYASRKRFDVWHATSIGDGSSAVALSTVKAGLRTVFTDHGFPVRSSREKRADHSSFEKVATQIHTYLAMSQPAADALWRDYKRTATVISPGVDTDRFAVGTDREPRPTVLYSGTFAESRKNVGLLLDAVELLLASRPELQVWLVGEGDVGALLESRPESVRNTVTVAGPARSTDELVERYQRAWVTALPSDAEVFGMALAESLSCGTPGLGLDDGLGPSTILTKQTGVLAERSAAGLARGLEAALVLATKHSTRTAARERAMTFDWKRAVVPAIEDVYRAEKHHDHHHH